MGAALLICDERFGLLDGKSAVIIEQFLSVGARDAASEAIRACLSACGAACAASNTDSGTQHRSARSTVLSSWRMGGQCGSFGSPLSLIVLSHGTGGSAQMMAWLGRALASRGYIAAAVNHPGNNALEEYTAEGFLIWWERARDLTSVIDMLVGDSQFGRLIDRSRIGAAGFSLGGYTNRF
jgi:predicted dienelactone hydrolase